MSHSTELHNVMPHSNELHSIMSHTTELHSVMSHSTELHSVMSQTTKLCKRNVPQYWTMQRNVPQYWTMQRNVPQYWTTQRNVPQYWTTQHHFPWERTLSTQNCANIKSLAMTILSYLTMLLITDQWMNEWMSMAHWWNDSYREKLKYLNENLSQCHSVHYKFHKDWLGIEPVPPQREASS
jgi:hypothetical protein